MKIIPDTERLQSGENISRTISFTIDEEYYGKTVKLGFVTPMGKIYITEALTYSDGGGSYPLPCSLLDGKGVLLCQLFVTDGNEYICKSPVLELPVYQSLDDMSCPKVSDETLKSLALIFEALENKSEIGHLHDDRYYTEAETDAFLKKKSEASHLHEGVYLTEEELREFVSSEMSGGYEHIHDDRYYTESEISELLSEKSESGHTHSFSQLTDKPSINGITVEGDMDVNGLMYRRVLTSSDDLDDIFEDGVYVYSTSSLPQNAPFANAAVVEVFGVKSTSAQKIQRAYRYGSPGYSAFRPLYSGAWGKWTYPLVTEDNANSLVTDYVVQQGTSGVWSYRKWSSGLAECWGTVDITLSKDAYLWDGNIYCASGYGGSVLTSVFTAYTCVSIDPIQWYQIGASGRVTAGGTLEGNVFGKTASMSSLTKGDTVTVNCIVKGRWK